MSHFQKEKEHDHLLFKTVRLPLLTDWNPKAYPCPTKAWPSAILHLLLSTHPPLYPAMGPHMFLQKLASIHLLFPLHPRFFFSPYYNHLVHRGHLRKCITWELWVKFYLRALKKRDCCQLQIGTYHRLMPSTYSYWFSTPPERSSG